MALACGPVRGVRDRRFKTGGLFFFKNKKRKMDYSEAEWLQGSTIREAAIRLREIGRERVRAGNAEGLPVIRYQEEWMIGWEVLYLYLDGTAGTIFFKSFEERDWVLKSLREELGNMNNENETLRRELREDRIEDNRKEVLEVLQEAGFRFEDGSIRESEDSENCGFFEIEIRSRDSKEAILKLHEINAGLPSRLYG